MTTFLCIFERARRASMCIMKSTVLVGSDQVWGRAILSLCICILARYEITLSLFRQPLYESHSRSPPLPTPKDQKRHTHDYRTQRLRTHKKRDRHTTKNAIRTHAHTQRRAAQWLATVTVQRYVHFSTARRRTNGDPARGNINQEEEEESAKKKRGGSKKKVD